MIRRLAAVLAAVALSVASVPASAAPTALRQLRWGTPTLVDPPRGLASISCVSRTLCRAGDVGNRIQRWNGADWLLGNSVSSDSAVGIVDVSCTSATFCAAVQLLTTDGNIFADRYRPVVRLPNGSWDASALTVSAPEWRYSSPDTDLSCVSESFCMLVKKGTYQVWSGTSWSAPRSFARTGVPEHVACVTASMCRAVNRLGELYSWNGRGWSAAVRLGPRGVGIDCASLTSCTVLTRGGALRWNGTAWGPLDRFDPGLDPVFGSLLDISCPTASFCAAIDSAGYVFTYSAASGWGGRHRLSPAGQLQEISCPGSAFCVAITDSEAIHLVDGAWQAPRPADVALGDVSGVGCDGQDRCVLVDANGGFATLTGSTWTAPQAVDLSTSFTDVSCAGDGFCMASGVHGRIRIRSHGTWGSPVVVVDDEDDGLRSVDCGTPTSCVARTYFAEDVYRWNGSAFGLMVSGRSENVTAAGCGRDGCVATFTDLVNGTDSYTAVHRATDGRTHIVQPPQGDPQQMSCVTVSFCMTEQQEVFDGSQWIDTHTDDLPSYLSAVSCATPTFCVGLTGLFAYVWDGTAWGAPRKIIDADTPGLIGSFEDLTCTATRCVAVDRYGWAVIATVAR